jgi:hypothetical protein
LQVTGEIFFGRNLAIFCKKKKKSANCLYSADAMPAQMEVPYCLSQLGEVVLPYPYIYDNAFETRNKSPLSTYYGAPDFVNAPFAVQCTFIAWKTFL